MVLAPAYEGSGSYMTPVISAVLHSRMHRAASNMLVS